MNYGNFSKDGREFIIDNQETPSPWINYIYNGRYFSTISNNGGGISYYKSPLHGRITRYRINDVPPDRPGKYIYIKDRDTGEIWSLTWQPVGRNLKAYKVAHGFAYTRAECEVEGIASSVLFFVPLDDDQEIWKTILTNKSNKKRSLSVYGYVEFALGHAMVDLINQCDDQHFNRVHFEKGPNSIFATKTYWVTETKGTQQQENKEWDQWAFFTVNKQVSNYETVRERFIGPYRTESNPIAIEAGNLSSQDTDYGNTVGALQIDIDLEPGETTDLIFSLGVIEKTEFEKQKNTLPVKYHDAGIVDKAFMKVQENWNDYFKSTWVETPDRDTNIFMNFWTPYQAKVAFDIGRVISFYYWGIGRGFGFRDTAQDTIAITIAYPEKAKERILLLARQMFRDGRVYHHFYNDGQGELTKHCDDPLWFYLAVSDYLKETGDFDILGNVQPFADGGSGTILEHLYAILTFVRNNEGKHGLPVFGRGDWNDTLDYIGGDDGGESVWGGMFYVSMINLLIDLLEELSFTEKLSEIIELRDKIKDSINKHCWDGDWFIRAFGANDRKIGASENEAGKIFQNTQSWAVIGKIAEKDKLVTAMNSLDKHLATDIGVKICAPAYHEIDPTIGLITRCVWGKKENGAIFNHPATWVIQAECMLGRGNKAYDYYIKHLPNRVEQNVFNAEPYVYSQYITSNEHSEPGKASHSWQTGTAAWMYRVSLDYILGIRASYKGLLINPSIPSKWKSYKVERKFRDSNYKIEVSNPEGIECGVKKIIVDGKEISGNIIPLSTNDVCIVKVIMG